MRKISEEVNKNITETFLDNGNEGVVQKRSLDVQPILENNKRLYNQNDGYSPDKGLKRIATIPTIILEIWTKYWICFKNTKHGIKHTGLGHDGDGPNIKSLLKYKTNLLKTPGNYVEVSGDAFDSFVGYGGAPIIDDEETVRNILGPGRSSETTWHGKHPTDPSKSGEGWYTRILGGGEHTKIMVGIPR